MPPRLDQAVLGCVAIGSAHVIFHYRLARVTLVLREAGGSKVGIQVSSKALWIGPWLQCARGIQCYFADSRARATLFENQKAETYRELFMGENLKRTLIVSMFEAGNLLAGLSMVGNLSTCESRRSDA